MAPLGPTRADLFRHGGLATLHTSCIPDNYVLGSKVRRVSPFHTRGGYKINRKSIYNLASNYG